jgi:hypothetical protein
VRPFFFVMTRYQFSPDSVFNIGALVFCCAAFLLTPFKIASLGYMPPDDALRHVAYSVDNRGWSEVLVLNPDISTEVDSHPGWHGLLRSLHQLGLSAEDLVVFSFCLTFVGYALVGLIFSGSPVAWVVICFFTMLVEGGVFGRLLLGRPFAISMMVFVVMLFIWSRERSLKFWIEVLLTTVLLSLSIAAHPTVWYIWSLPGAVLVFCRRWRSFFSLLMAGAMAMVLATLMTGSAYNIWQFPFFVIINSFGSDYLIVTNLVGEFQPSGAPVLVLFAVAGLLAVKHFKGGRLRDEFQQVDFVLMVLMWLLGLKIMRFWVDWGVPAFMVWSCRQVISFGLDRYLSPRDQFGLAACASLALYLGMSADLGGRYTYALKSPLLTKPVEEFRHHLPPEGGILYCTDMGVFYKLYYRLPQARFRFTTGFEPGMLPPDDLKTLRYIQFNDGLIESYKSWFEKMTDRDRILFYYQGKPEWPGFKFEQFYTAWIGRKLTDAEKK